MSCGGYWIDMLTVWGVAKVPSFDDFTFLMTHETQAYENVQAEAGVEPVEVQMNEDVQAGTGVGLV